MTSPDDLGRRREAALERALTGFRSTEDHKNCAQAVMLYAAARLSAGEEFVDVARYMGGGLARSGGPCGVITGAALALGLRDAVSPDVGASWLDDGCREIQELQDAFAAEFGALECRALTGCNMRDDAERERFGEQGLRESHCVGYLRWVTARLDPLLDPDRR